MVDPDFAHQGETQTSAVGLGREEGGEESWLDILAEPSDVFSPAPATRSPVRDART